MTTKTYDAQPTQGRAETMTSSRVAGKGTPAGYAYVCPSASARARSAVSAASATSAMFAVTAFAATLLSMTLLSIRMIATFLLRRTPMVAGFTALALVAACGGGGGGGGGIIPGSVITAISTSTGGTSGIGSGRTTVTTGAQTPNTGGANRTTTQTSQPRQSTVYSNNLAQDLAANQQSQQAGTSTINNINLTNPSSMTRTSVSQGEVNRTEAVTIYQGQTLKVENLEDRTRSGSLLFIGGQPASSSSSSQGQGTAPLTNAFGRSQANSDPRASSPLLARQDTGTDDGSDADAVARVIINATAEPLESIAIATAKGTYSYSGAFAWQRNDNFEKIHLGFMRAKVEFRTGADGRQNGIDFTMDAGTDDDPATSEVNERTLLEFGRRDGVRIGAGGNNLIQVSAATGSFAIASSDYAGGGPAKSGNGFQFGEPSAPWMHFTLNGQLGGLDAEVITAVFTANMNPGQDTASAGRFAGGIVGSGNEVMKTEDALPNNGSGIGRARVALTNTGREPLPQGQPLGTAPAYLTSPDYETLYSRVNAASNDAVNPESSALLPSLNRHLHSGFTDTGPGTVVKGVTKRAEHFTSGADNQSAEVTRYDDPKSSAVMALVDGSRHNDFATFVVAGGGVFEPSVDSAGDAIPLTGTHIFVGAQLVANFGALEAPVISAISLTFTFSGGRSTFTYATDPGQTGAVVKGSGIVTQSDGTILSDDGQFSAGVAGEPETQAKLRGRFTGAWRGVSGVFSTTTSTTETDPGHTYAGGFIAHSPEIATLATGSDFNASTGIISASNVQVGDLPNVRHAFLLTSNAKAIADVANAPATSTTSLVRSITPAFGTAAPTPDVIAGTTTPGGYGTLVRPDVNFTYGGQSVSASVFYDRSLTANLVVLHGASNTPTISAIAAAGVDFSGQLTGDYKFTGGYYWAPRATPHDIKKGTFTLTASFNAAGAVSSFKLDASTNTSVGQTSLVFQPTTTVTLESGSFKAVGGRFRAGAGTYLETDLHGVFAGADGAAVSGVFVTKGLSTAATQYAGAIVGTGGGTSSLAGELFRSNEYGVDGGVAGATPLTAIAGDISTAVGDYDHASNNTRNAAFIAGLVPTYTGDTTRTGDVNRRTGTQRHGGHDYPVVRYTVRGNQAKLLVVDGSGATGTDPFGSAIIATGRPFTASGLTGTSSFDGVLVAGDANSMHDVATNTITLALDFTNSSFSVSTASRGGADGTANALHGLALSGGSINLATGALSASTLSFTPAGSPDALTGSLIGQLHSGAESSDNSLAVSGVFRTSNQNADKYAGGILAISPRNANRLAKFGTATTAAGVGAGLWGLVYTREQADHAHFVVENIDSHINDANSVSQATRSTALFAVYADSFAATPANTTRVGAGPNGQYAGNAVNRITGSLAHEDLTGVAQLYQSDTDISVAASGTTNLPVVRLVFAQAIDATAPATGRVPSNIVASGLNREGTLSGTHTWEGVFVASKTTDGDYARPTSANENGTFMITANISNGTFDFLTRDDEGGNLSGRGGTIDPAEGTLSMTSVSSALSFTPAQAGSSQITRVSLYGRVYGDVRGNGATGPSGVAGVFVTNETGTATATDYVGGFLGTGPVIANSDTRFTLGGTAGLARATLSLDGQPKGSALVIGHDIARVVVDANSSSDATRSAALLRSLTIDYDSRRLDNEPIQERRVGHLTVGGERVDLVRYGNDTRVAKILVTGSATGGPDANTAIIAGGAAFTGPVPTGKYRYTGVHVVAGPQNLARAGEAASQGSFQMHVDFTAGSFSYDGASQNVDGVAAATRLVATNGALQAASGTFSTATARYQAGADDDDELVASLHGRFHGAAIGVSGVFATGVPSDGAENDRRLGAFAGSGAAVTLTPRDAALVGMQFAQQGVGLDAELSDSDSSLDELIATMKAVADLTGPQFNLLTSGPALATATSRHGTVNTPTARPARFWFDRDSSTNVWMATIDPAVGMDIAIVHGEEFGTGASGTYNYNGIIVGGSGTSLADAATGTFTLRAEFNSLTSARLTGFSATLGESTLAPRTDVTLDAAINATTGRFNDGSFEFKESAGSDEEAAVVQGRFHGSAAQAVSGVWGTGGQAVAGAFIGNRTATSAPSFDKLADIGTFGAAKGTHTDTSDDAANPPATTDVIFIARDIDAQVSAASGASGVGWLNEALDATLGTAETGKSDTNVAFKAGSITVSTETVAIKAYEETGGNAALLYLDAAADDTFTDRIVVRGKPFTGSITGNVSYKGKVTLADQFVNAGEIVHASEVIDFNMTINTTAGTFEFDASGTSPVAGKDVIDISGGAIDVSTGRMSDSDFTYTRGSDGTDTPLLRNSEFVGQLYGAGGAAVGGIYWGEDASTSGADTTHLGGAFIGKKQP